MTVRETLSALAHDVRLAARSLRRSPAFVIAAGLSLTLGIGAGVAGFSMLDAVRFRALPFPNADRLVTISEVPVGGCPATCDVHWKTFALLREHQFRSIDALAGFSDGPKSLGTGENQVDLTVSIISSTLLPILGVSPERGRNFTADEDRLGAAGTVLIGHQFWVNHLGADSAIVGKTVILSDEPFTVIGIMPAGFDFESRSEAWLAASRYLDPRTGTSRRWSYVLARLSPGATIGQLTGELRTLEAAANELHPERPKTTFAVEPLRARYAGATQSHDLIFAAVVGAILLIACANVASLVLVRVMRQRRELAVRSAIGASAGRLTRYLFVQNLLIAGVGLVAGLVLAALSLETLRAAAPLPTIHVSAMQYRIDGRVIMFAIALAGMMAAVLSMAPLPLIRRATLQQTLREGAITTTSSRAGNRAHSAFVVLQAACAVTLLVGTGLMVKTVLRFGGLRLGYDADHVAQITPVPAHAGRVKAQYLPMSDRLLVDFATIPGVEMTALRATVPYGSTSPTETPTTTIDDGRTLSAEQQPRNVYGVSPDYFRVMGIPLIHGRAFAITDVETAPPVAIVNEWAASHWWPGTNPVGRSFSVDTARGVRMTITVVGVVRDNMAAQRTVLLAKPGPEVYRPYPQANFWITSFFARTHGATSRIVDAMQRRVMRVIPNGRPPAALMSTQVDDQLRSVRATLLEIAGFALVGLILALTGLYGVLAYIVQQRTREIGIRAVLGATRRRLFAMVVSHALLLAVIGIVAGSFGAIVAMRWIGNVFVGTPPTDIAVYAAVAVLFLIVTIVASVIPARRAMTIDPANALRQS